MFSTKEQEIIKWGLDNGKSKEEVARALTNFRVGITPKEAKPQEQSFLQDAGSDLKQVVSDSSKSMESRAGKVQEALDAGVAGKQGALRTTAQVVGQGAGLASDIIGNIFKGVTKAALPQGAENAVKSGISSVVAPVVESDIVKNVISKYNSLDEKTKRDIDAALGVASLAADLAGGGAAKKGVQKTAEMGIKAGRETLETGAKIASSATPAVETIGKFATGVKDVASATANEIAQIPGRIATNVADSQTTMKAIKQLPTKVAKDAVQNGVDINDVKYLYKLPAEQKQPLRQLFTAVKNFASGTSKTNPIEIVGKPIVERIKTLKTSLGQIGKKLGNAADKLGSVTTDEIFPKIFDSLKKVPGLNGLKVGEDGVLDFSNTILTTAETAADRKAIQQIFTDAIKAGSGKQKHLLRQELFEVLGGKKGALVAMTDTQDKAYQAIREGLSNVLDAKNSSYKLLNNQYRKVVQPLNDIGKFMKLNKLAGAGEDILNMDAGLLARRLTSNAVSNPEIRNILRALDKATKVAGKTTINVENLQDLYNLLDKYYNIAAGTGLQKQVGLGVEKASGVVDALFQAGSKVAGRTDAVRMKAIEDVINEALDYKSAGSGIMKKNLIQGEIPSTNIIMPKKTLYHGASKYSYEAINKAQKFTDMTSGVKYDAPVYFSNSKKWSEMYARLDQPERAGGVLSFNADKLKIATNKEAQKILGGRPFDYFGLPVSNKNPAVIKLKEAGFDGAEYAIGSGKNKGIVETVVWNKDKLKLIAKSLEKKKK